MFTQRAPRARSRRATVPAVTLAALALVAGIAFAKDDHAVERGKYLVTAAGCNDCHTPLVMGPNGPEPDMSRMLSGHPASMPLPPPPTLSAGPWNWVGSGSLTAFAGPWGISYARNLTPDKGTGLGGWTVDEFIQTLRTGHERGTGRALLPPMPWRWVGQLTDDDLRAVFAYLQSIPPVRNRVPDPVPPPSAAQTGN